jgi:ABC-type Fe3+/spermidine/putrescine transport system ATPase subunit
MPFLEWRSVSKQFGGTRALDRVSLAIGEGEILGILGPSGSGKSTLLRVTAGLEPPGSGRILLQGRDLAGEPPHRRDFGLMFQDYCLFPHLDVGANVGFGLRMKRWPTARRAARVEEMLRLVRMKGFDRRSVHSLSGGEQQRVALARSLAPAPRLLMLDEPLGALDAALRAALQPELAEILAEVGVTALYVTHDHDEAMTMGRRVALMHRGALAQVGSPEELISAPANAFVASFLGLGALVPGSWKRSRHGWVFATLVADLPGPGSTARVKDGDGVGQKTRSAVWGMLVRPDAVQFARRRGAVSARARVASRRVSPGGSTVVIALIGRDGTEYPLERRADRGAPPEGPLTVWIDAEACLPLRL